MRLTSIDILQVWSALGGGELRRKRGQAFWRGGDGYSIALDTAKAAWFDHRDARGGGVLALVETALGCDRRAAIQWLETHCGLDPRRPLSPGDRRRYEAATDILATRLSDFARGLEIATGRPLAVLSWALLELGIDPAETLAERHRHAHVLKQANARDIAHTWREVRLRDGAAVDGMERIGSDDREHAESVTRAIVAILAQSQARMAA